MVGYLPMDRGRALLAGTSRQTGLKLIPEEAHFILLFRVKLVCVVFPALRCCTRASSLPVISRFRLRGLVSAISPALRCCTRVPTHRGDSQFGDGIFVEGCFQSLCIPSRVEEPALKWPVAPLTQRAVFHLFRCSSSKTTGVQPFRSCL